MERGSIIAKNDQDGKMQEKDKIKRNTRWFGRLLIDLGGGLFYVLPALTILGASKVNISVRYLFSVSILFAF